MKKRVVANLKTCCFGKWIYIRIEEPTFTSCSRVSGEGTSLLHGHVSMSVIKHASLKHSLKGPVCTPRVCLLEPWSGSRFSLLKEVDLVQKCHGMCSKVNLRVFRQNKRRSHHISSECNLSNSRKASPSLKCYK